MNKRVLVVAAHPDDEILGCGGTILKHIAMGDKVHILILSEGITSRDETRTLSIREKELSELHQATNNVAKFLGAESVIICNFPDNRMDSIPLIDVVKKIETEVNNFQPDTVYTHHVGDVNIDHRITHEAVITACRPLPNMSVRNIFFFETLSSTEWQIASSDKIFCPNVYVDIEDYIDKKIEALHYYESEMRNYPHSRSYEAVKILAQQRGFTIGRYYAEAFMLGRMIFTDNHAYDNCDVVCVGGLLKN